MSFGSFLLNLIMNNFYTNVKVWGNNVLYRGIKDGKKIQRKIEYKPSLYIPIKEESKYKTIFGENLQRINFDSIKESKDFLKKYEGIENFKIYGNVNYEYCVISELFHGQVEFDISQIRIAIFDIETNSDPETGGYAAPDNPFQPIISIALKFLGEDKSYLFGYHDFDAPENVIYIKCRDEYTLCKKFIDVWSLEYPDIVSGWRSDYYDIPYLIGRFNRIISEQETKKLSPWGLIQERKNKTFVKELNKYVEELSYSIGGIASLDYIELYKKFDTGEPKENYKLDYISNIELGENKVEYDGSLHRLYTEDVNKFYLYNIHDVILVEKLETKCKFFSLSLTLTYDSKTNYDDVFRQTRMWDSLIFNHLKTKDVQIPQKGNASQEEYEGAFVKQPKVGIHKWLVTVDGTSLYPSLMASLNISPETYVKSEEYTNAMRNIISQNVGVKSLLDRKIDLSTLKDDNVALAPNMTFFRVNKKGFLFDIIINMFNDRKMYKGKMLEMEMFKEKISTEIKSRV